VWERQYQITVLALALLFTRFERLGPDSRWWFLRLAARAGAVVLGKEPPNEPDRVLTNLFEPPAADTVSDDVSPSAPSPVFALTARSWHVGRAGHADEAARYLLQAQAQVSALALPDALRGTRDLLADAIHILGADHEMVLRLRYHLALTTASLPHGAGDARRLFEVARVECARVLGRDHPWTEACRQARDAPSLVRRENTGG
jgi:hypothetical protein